MPAVNCEQITADWAWVAQGMRRDHDDFHAGLE